MTKVLRALFVEDSEDDRLLTLRALEEAFDEVISERVETPEAFADALKRQTWDVIISDHRLPHFDSASALKLLQRAELDTPFIIVSGVMGEDFAVAAMKNGAHDYVLKGNLARLVPAVIREIREANVRRERTETARALRASEHLRASTAQELAESEERFRATFEQAAVGIAHVAIDGRFLKVNSRYCDLLGYSQELLLQRRMEEVGYPEDVQEDSRRAAALIDGQAKSYTTEYRYLRPDGVVAWSQLTVSLVRRSDGEPHYFIAVAEDIGARKESEIALRWSEKRFRALVEAVPQIVWTARPDGWFDYYNQRWVEYTGIAVDDAIGPGWQSVVHPDDIQGCLAAWAAALQEGELYSGEYRLRRAPEGAYRWHLVRALPLRDDAGGVTKWFGTWTDVDDQKVAERSALDAVQLRDDFLSVASHELKTPLTSLKLQVELAARDAAEEFPDSARRLAARLVIIERQVDRLNELITDLLDVTRLSRGALPLKLEWLLLSDVVRECAERMRPQLTRASCDFRWVLEEGVSGWWDSKRLDGVIANLLANAMKFGAGKPVTLEGRAEGDTAILIISDQGIGIAPEARQRIFEKFERAVPWTNYGGVGLGLYLAREAVRAMNGTLTVESVVGAGATFTVRLPRQPRRAALSGHGLPDPTHAQPGMAS